VPRREVTIPSIYNVTGKVVFIFLFGVRLSGDLTLNAKVISLDSSEADVNGYLIGIMDVEAELGSVKNSV
jgi:hypothetical protein